MPQPECRAFQPSEPPDRRARRSSLLALLGFLGLGLLASLSGAAASGSAQGWFRSLDAPPLTPPDWLFGPIWTVLYASLGVAAWLVWRRMDVATERKRAALRAWGWQLLLNAAWPPVFFGLHSLAGGMLAMMALLASAAWTMRAFWPVQRGAALLLVPYLAAVMFAAYLNAELWRLNPGWAIGGA